MVLTTSNGAPIQGGKPQTTKNGGYSNPYITQKDNTTNRYKSPNQRANQQQEQRRSLK